MIHQIYPFIITEAIQTDNEIFEELIQTAARIPRIDKIIDLWEEDIDTDDDRMSLVGLRRYLDYMTHYPIPTNKFYLSCDPNGAIGLTAYFDTYKLIMRFDFAETITYIKWGDYSERLPRYGH